MNQDDYHILVMEMVNIELLDILDKLTKRDNTDVWTDCVDNVIARIKTEPEYTAKETVKDLKNNFREMIKNTGAD